MWQIICLCLPTISKREQQRFFTLLGDALHTQSGRPGAMDMSLFFLSALSADEALTVLEERLDLVARSQELLEQSTWGLELDLKQFIINDHMQTLLAAEHEWLKRTTSLLQSKSVRQNQKANFSVNAH